MQMNLYMIGQFHGNFERLRRILKLTLNMSQVRLAALGPISELVQVIWYNKKLYFLNVHSVKP